jgi:hypothetical protein
MIVPNLASPAFLSYETVTELGVGFRELGAALWEF